MRVPILLFFVSLKVEYFDAVILNATSAVCVFDLRGTTCCNKPCRKEGAPCEFNKCSAGLPSFPSLFHERMFIRPGALPLQPLCVEVCCSATSNHSSFQRGVRLVFCLLKYAVLQQALTSDPKAVCDLTSICSSKSTEIFFHLRFGNICQTSRAFRKKAVITKRALEGAARSMEVPKGDATKRPVVRECEHNLFF